MILIGSFTGVMAILKPLLSLSTHVRHDPHDQAIEQMRQSGTQTLINWFMLGWFLIGSYWVYRIYEPNYDPSLGKYCNANLYRFSFYLITGFYLLAGFMLLLVSLITILSLIFFSLPAFGQQTANV